MEKKQHINTASINESTKRKSNNEYMREYRKQQKVEAQSLNNQFTAAQLEIKQLKEQLNQATLTIKNQTNNAIVTNISTLIRQMPHNSEIRLPLISAISHNIKSDHAVIALQISHDQLSRSSQSNSMVLLRNRNGFTVSKKKNG